MFKEKWWLQDVVRFYLEKADSHILFCLGHKLINHANHLHIIILYDKAWYIAHTHGVSNTDWWHSVGNRRYTVVWCMICYGNSGLLPYESTVRRNHQDSKQYSAGSYVIHHRQTPSVVTVNSVSCQGPIKSLTLIQGSRFWTGSSSRSRPFRRGCAWYPGERS